MFKIINGELVEDKLSVLIHKLKWPIRFVKHVWSVAKWLPVIWKDRQWDEAYLFIIMAHKFGLMEQYFKHHGTSADSEKQGKTAKVCRILCERLADSSYTTPWDEDTHKSAESFFGYMFSHTERVGSLTCRTSEGYSEPKRWSNAVKWFGERQDEMEIQDLKYLLKMIGKHSRTWWD